MSVHDSEGDKMYGCINVKRLFFLGGGDKSPNIPKQSQKRCSFNSCCRRRLQSPNDVALQKI